MSNNIFFDDEQYDELIAPNGEFNFLIHQLTKDNAKSVALDLMSNGQTDPCLKSDGIITYIVVQLPPGKGDIVEWIEETRVKHSSDYSNLTNNIYLKGAIKKKSPDGLVSTIDNIKTLSDQVKSQSQNITINQGGACTDCQSRKEIERLRIINEEQQHTIDNLVTSLTRNVSHISAELGIVPASNCGFKGNPTKAQKLFMASTIPHTESMEDFNDVFEHAKLYENVEALLHREELLSALSELNHVSSALNIIICLSTSPDSEAGAKISTTEWCHINKMLGKLRKTIGSLSKQLSDLKE